MDGLRPPALQVAPGDDGGVCSRVSLPARPPRRTHGLLQTAQQEKEEAAYLARQDKQILAAELSARHVEALQQLEQQARRI